MGGEVKTNVSDDFKVLEVEMGLRHEGIIVWESVALFLLNQNQAWRNCINR